MHIVVLGLFIALSLTGLAQAQGLSPNTITVTGRAQVFAAPDYATINMGVVSSGKTVAGAAQENASAMSRVVAALSKMGISNRDVQTKKYNVEAVHAKDANGQEDETRTTGYRVANKVTVTVLNITSLANVIDAATLSGANSIDSIDFQLKNKSDAEDNAKKDAVKDARHQAEILAGAEGTKIRKMITMTTGSVNYGVESVESVIVTGSRFRSSPILPGQIEIRASVTVQYAVE